MDTETVSFLCLTPGPNPKTGQVNKTNIGTQNGKRDHTPFGYNTVHEVHRNAARVWAAAGLGIIDGREFAEADISASFADADPKIIAELRSKMDAKDAEIEALKSAVETVDPLAEFRSMVGEARKEVGLAPIHHRAGMDKLKDGYAEAIRAGMEADKPKRGKRTKTIKDPAE